MLTVRTSRVEAFRKLLESDFSRDEDEDNLVQALMGNEPMGNQRMAAGTAWHRAIARDQPDRVGTEAGTFGYGCFDFLEGDVADAVAYVGPGLVEWPAGRVFPVNGHRLRLTGTCDRLQGLVIRDAKTCLGTPDIQDYEQSLQWRIYLLLHGAEMFAYDLFDFKEPRDGLMTLKGVQTHRMWKYPGMEADVVFWLKEFLDWAEGRKLLRYLEYPA